MRVVLVIVLFIASGLITLWLVPDKKPSKHAENRVELPVEPAKEDVRDVTPNNALPGPDVSGEFLNRLPAKIKPKPKIIKPQQQTYQNLLVTAAGVLKTKDSTLEIRDIEPLKLDAMCQTESGQSWPCGRFARTALRQLILNHAISCEPTEANTTPIIVKCKIGGRDIGQWLVRQGWAKSVGDAYAGEMATAKENLQGMWRKTLP